MDEWSAKYCHHKVPKLVQVNPDKQEEKRITYPLRHPGSIVKNNDQFRYFSAKYCHLDKQFMSFNISTLK